jgi:hypothetical protein
VLRRPQDFAIELDPGDSWTVLNAIYKHNPLHLLDHGHVAVHGLWRQCQGGFGLAALPDAGGINDQAAWTLDAFSIMNAADAELTKQQDP